jgi:hypothetical protein
MSSMINNLVINKVIKDIFLAVYGPSPFQNKGKGLHVGLVEVFM